ncbi:uncharacterized protein LOC134764027 [Penaeus indicus]|uniref:uncharacterized protein LOC134764027 n=1 Tax=Penaeus indicus TaxID=29960 RepID=UPI00300C7C46
MKSSSWNKPCPRSVSGARSAAPRVRPSRGHPEVRQERQEIREYLDKLRHLVPACPKDGKLSRLAVIQHVIDYIVELQDALVHHPVNTLVHHPVNTLMHHPVNSLLAANEELAATLTNPLFAKQQLSSNKSVNSSSAITSSTTKNNSNNNSSCNDSIKKNSSSCRRPLGVLSSLKNHRNQ